MATIPQWWAHFAHSFRSELRKGRTITDRIRRKAVPAAVVRAVLVEAGHRCAIPTCGTTTTEIAHIVDWAKTQDDSFENLIALCPTCHTRYDQKKEMDLGAIRMYKHNLGILNNRYGEFERRMFALLADSGDEFFVVGAGGDLMLANAIKDGFFADQHVDSMSFRVTSNSGLTKSFPMTFTYVVTAEGTEFLKRFAEGRDFL